MVSLCWLIRLIGVCADRDQPEFLCSRSDSRYLEVHVATAGGWLTRYHPREVRNSIYRYRKIHINYRSKFLYRFISPILIIYGNTNFKSKPTKMNKYLFYVTFLSFNYHIVDEITNRIMAMVQKLCSQWHSTQWLGTVLNQTGIHTECGSAQRLPKLELSNQLECWSVVSSTQCAFFLTRQAAVYHDPFSSI